LFKSYKYRLYPTEDQLIKIDHTINVCRFVYNLALETKILAYQSARKNLSAYDLHSQLPELKEANPWMKEVDSQALQFAIRQMDSAFQKFFNGAGFPKFKSKHKSRLSFHAPNNTRRINWALSTITIPKIENIPAILDRPFKGTIKDITISKTPTGKYFASILVDNKAELPAKPPISEATAIGIDVGIKSFVVTSDGRQFEPNRKLKSNLKRLQCLQRRASRKQKGSNNRKKANLCVATLHEKITNQRTDYIHQVTTRLIRDNQTESIVIEDLGVAGMLKNGNLAQAISDVSFGKFFEVLKYKCDWYGKNLIVIARWAPSSKRCSCCGAINGALTLADRAWTCAECGTRHDRDYNASQNIKWYGLQQIIFKEKTPEGIGEELVESRRLRRAEKQELIQSKD
jgi:putative transposase